jgi:hypothetical protein
MVMVAPLINGLDGLAVALLGEVDVRLGGLASLLLEAVQDVDGVADARHIDDSVGVALGPDPDLPAAWPNRGHRLPVGRVTPRLDQVELVAGALACHGREAPKVVPGASDEHHVLHHDYYTGFCIIRHHHPVGAENVIYRL